MTCAEKKEKRKQLELELAIHSGDISTSQIESVLGDEIRIRVNFLCPLCRESNELIIGFDRNGEDGRIRCPSCEKDVNVRYIFDGGVENE